MRKSLQLGKLIAIHLEAFPVNSNFGDADSFIILIEAHLAGSDFSYGFITEK